LEAGHAFQNMNLMAAACNVGAVNIGAFFDSEIAGLLKIVDGEELPIYATVLGNRAESS
jgi:nitroreductase